MASRHSRLALKGNTYTQIGLKVWYVGGESGRRRRGAGGGGGADGLGLRQGGRGRRRRRRRRYAMRRCVRIYIRVQTGSAMCRMCTYTRKTRVRGPVHTYLYEPVAGPPSQGDSLTILRSAVCSTITRPRESPQKRARHTLGQIIVSHIVSRRQV